MKLIRNLKQFLGLATRDGQAECKRLLAAVIDDYPAGGKALAYEMEIPYHRLRAWCNPDKKHHNIRLDQLIRIFHITQDFRILHFLCELFGHVCMPLPEAMPGTAAICEEIGGVIEASGHVAAKLGQSLASGQIDLHAACSLRDKNLHLFKKSGYAVRLLEYWIEHKTPERKAA